MDRLQKTSPARGVRAAVAVVAVLSAAALGLVAPGGAFGAGHSGSGAARVASGTRLVANLNGAREVPGPGDPNGTGRAVIRLHRALHKVCVRATWSHIGTPNAAHIHIGARGVAGGVKVTLSTAVTGGSHCKGSVSGKLIRRIKRHPGNFYFNIHTNAFPGGAIRGQLHH